MEMLKKKNEEMKASQKEKVNEADGDSNVFAYEVVIKGSKEVNEEFQDALDALFKEYYDKTDNGYIKVLYDDELSDDAKKLKDDVPADEPETAEDDIPEMEAKEEKKEKPVMDENAKISLRYL